MKRLSPYRKKRDPQNTPEPMDDRHESDETLSFVVQKHKASHLHYDLRLELDGVLKSWAVPKGFPYLEGEKRVAILVEDHPFSYKDFEGEIPLGNYGAGTMEIWDQGNFSTTEALEKNEAQKQLHAGLKKGHVAVVLNGEKLSGVYHLVRAEQKGQSNTWLLFRNAKKKEISEKMPEKVSPMLAHSADKPFNKEGWLFEIKWDGYRTITKIANQKVQLFSRNQKSFTRQFKLIANELAALQKHDLVLDGEVVVLDEDGRSNFSLLQNAIRSKEGNLYYYVFDLIFCDGYDLRSRPLIERKERLEVLLYPLRNSRIRYSDHVEENGVQFFDEAKRLGLEGVIAKNKDSQYQEERSRDWLKIRASRRGEFVIAGFIVSTNRKHFSSLMLGYYKGKEFIFAGLVGSGFSDTLLEEMASKLESLSTAQSPFNFLPKMSRKVKFVKPLLVCELSFTEWTNEGLLRHPVFLGLRLDKEAKSVKADPFG